MKVVITTFLIIWFFIICIKKNDPELIAEVSDFKFDCGSNPVVVGYEFSQMKFSGNRTGNLSKKGRVSCGVQFLDFNAVYSDGHSLAFLDITFKQKKHRLMEASLTPNANKLFQFEASDKTLSWVEHTLFAWYKCLFYYNDGKLYCEKI